MTAGVRNMTGALTSVPTVSAGLARGLLRFAVARGANEAALLRRSGIELVSLHDQDHRVPFASYVALMRAGQELAADPALALHFAASVDLSEISIVGLIAHTCETMSDVLAQLNRYNRLVAEYEIEAGGDRFVHEAAGDGKLWLVDRRRNPNHFIEATESTFVRLVCGPRVLDRTRFCHEVHMTHAAPAYRDEYERIFGVPVVFGSDKNAALIDETWPARQIVRAHRYVFGILSDRAATLLEELQASKTTRGRVESTLLPILHKGEPLMAVVAKKLGLSRASLYRRLKAEGVSYDAVLDELRHRLALHYLEGRKVSISETAYLVGFAEPSAFSRAFKRWTGTSPAQRLSTR